MERHPEGPARRRHAVSIFLKDPATQARHPRLHESVKNSAFIFFSSGIDDRAFPSILLVEKCIKFSEAIFLADECPYPLFLTPSQQQPLQSDAFSPPPPDGMVHLFGLLSPTHRTSPLVVVCAAPVVCHECRTGGALRIGPLVRKGIGVDGLIRDGIRDWYFCLWIGVGCALAAISRGGDRSHRELPQKRIRSLFRRRRSPSVSGASHGFLRQSPHDSKAPSYPLKVFFFFKANRELFSADGGSLSTTKSCAPAFAVFQRALVAQRLPYRPQWSLVSAEPFSPRCAAYFNKTLMQTFFKIGTN